MNVDEIIPRIRANMGQKMVLSFALSIYFCAVYYLLQRHPLFPMTAIHANWLDWMIPFVPGTVYLYESIWLLTPIAPWLMESKAELNGCPDINYLNCIYCFCCLETCLHAAIAARFNLANLFCIAQQNRRKVVSK